MKPDPQGDVEVDRTPDPLKATMELDARYHFGIYRRFPILPIKGEGAIIIGSDGKEYLDMLAGVGVNGLGHCHPDVVRAVRDQAENLMHCSNFYYIEPQARLASLLVGYSDLDRVMFCNSGAEAVEGAIKLARRWGVKNGRGGTIVTMEDSFHGRTLAAVTATGQKKYSKDFDPLPGGFRTVPFNDTEALVGTVEDDVCAVMIEPVQGEGGINVADGDYLSKVRKLCDRKGLLLIFDEIQCGMGRTGHFFAYQGFGVVPDIVTLAKALGGGFPIGALLAKEDVACVFGPGDHGTTFGGNPLATAAAFSAVSFIINEKLPERCREMGNYLMSGLEDRVGNMDAVVDIRGLGLMVGVELDRDGKEVVNAMLERGVLGNCTAGNVIRFLPPITVTEDVLDRAMDVFAESLAEVCGND
jgi:predicted acetylornithine/succinylornithine family transaminase